MYLSRVQVDTQNRQKMKELTHLGAYHNWVEQSFPDEVQRGRRLRHLWRLDQLNGQQFLLVLSPDRPDLARLADFGIAGSAHTKNYDPFLERLSLNMKYQFRLTANPTKTVAVAGKRGRVEPHITVTQQMDWLSQRAGKAGFQILEGSTGPDFRIVDRSYPILRREHGETIRLSRVTFEGRLEIRDLEVFKQTLTDGLGREKAFGMGLMTVIPEVR